MAIRAAACLVAVLFSAVAIPISVLLMKTLMVKNVVEVVSIDEYDDDRLLFEGGGGDIESRLSAAGTSRNSGAPQSCLLKYSCNA